MYVLLLLITLGVWGVRAVQPVLPVLAFGPSFRQEKNFVQEFLLILVGPIKRIYFLADTLVENFLLGTVDTLNTGCYHEQ